MGPDATFAGRVPTMTTAPGGSDFLHALEILRRLIGHHEHVRNLHRAVRGSVPVLQRTAHRLGEQIVCRHQHERRARNRLTLRIGVEAHQCRAFDACRGRASPDSAAPALIATRGDSAPAPV